MNYELVNIINPGTKNWAVQKSRAIAENATVITLAPNAGTKGLAKSENANIINLIDYVVGRDYIGRKGLFFNRAPVPDGSEIFMNEDRSISILLNGNEIGMIDLYKGSRRYVKNINYTNADGSPDFSEEYTFEGSKYSSIYYSNGEVQQINFYNDLGLVIVTFFFYEGNINLIVVRDSDNQLEVKYNTLSEFYVDQVARLVKRADLINISYLGIELESIAKTNSHNTLYLEESPLDNKNKVKGNLHFILQKNVKWIEKVFMSEDNYSTLRERGEDLEKVFLNANYKFNPNKP